MTRPLTHSFTTTATPEQAFAAINDVRSWWSGHVEGDTATLGAEFVYSVPDVHMSRFRITELRPHERVAWAVVDSLLTFVEDREEWTGTTVTFDVAATDDGTAVTFTHHGLEPSHECFEVCDRAWGEYVVGSLRERVERGAGRPNSFEGDIALGAVANAQPARGGVG